MEKSFSNLSDLSGLAEELRRRFENHQVFRNIQECSSFETRTEILLGQYWHLLHYFPIFLARLCERANTIEQKTQISKILFQELGEGNSKKAHEVAFLEMIDDFNLSRQKVTSVPMFESTKNLLQLYALSSEKFRDGMGVLFATEVSDLQIVSGIWRAIRSPGRVAPEWVKLHTTQEPDHVASVNAIYADGFCLNQRYILPLSAEQCADLWKKMFDEIFESTTPAEKRIG